MVGILRVAAPHIRRERTTADVMGDVCIALVPPAIAAVWYFGMAAFWRLLLAAASSLAAARLCSRQERPDIAALVTGLILCLSCPSQIPLWLLVGGCFFAVCVARGGFGGLGQNLFNPAMAARALMLVIFPTFLTGYGLPDALSAATPLTTGADTWSLITGQVGGSMGETSVLMIGLGLLWLLIRRVVKPYAPLCSLLGFSAVILLSGQDLLTHLLSGSILFGITYIFTDYTGRPATVIGELVFSAGVGALAAALRVYGTYPEGVCFAVLLMNLRTPLLEYFTVRRRVHE